VVPLPRQFVSRLTDGEFAAIGALVSKWADNARAQGFPATTDNRTAWFRALIHREAAAQGVEILEPAPAAPPVPTPGGKSGAKRSKDAP
jgi:hypothetical protein